MKRHLEIISAIQGIFLTLTGNLAAAPEPPKTFRTLCHFPHKDIKTLSYLNKDQTCEVALPKMNLSPRYEYDGGSTILLGTPELKDGKPVIKPLARAIFPPNTHDAVLLFLPAPQGADLPFHVTVFSYEEEQFKKGQVIFVNLSNESVGGLFGNLKLMIPGGQTAKLESMPQLDNDGRYYVNISSRIGETWRPFCKSWWVSSPTERKLALIFKDPATQRLRLLSFPDREPAGSGKTSGD